MPKRTSYRMRNYSPYQPRSAYSSFIPVVASTFISACVLTLVAFFATLAGVAVSVWIVLILLGF